MTSWFELLERVLVDIVSVLSLQARARRNARKSLWILQRQRAERAEASRVLAAAQARSGVPTARARQHGLT